MNEKVGDLTGCRELGVLCAAFKKQFVIKSLAALIWKVGSDQYWSGMLRESKSGQGKTGESVSHWVVSERHLCWWK